MTPIALPSIYTELDPDTGAHLYPVGPLREAMSAVGATFGDADVEIHGDPDKGTGEFVAPGRRVVNLPGRTWASIPGECTADSDTEWLVDGKVLVCTGCGLDCT